MHRLIDLIKSEMKPSTGCTEPAAIGLAVSKTCQYLAAPAAHLSLRVSSNIFKNAYCVRIPGTAQSGIPLAGTLGFLLSRPHDTMDLFSGVTEELVRRAQDLIAQGFTDVTVRESGDFFIEVIARNSAETVTTLTFGSHDNMVRAQKDGVLLFDRSTGAEAGPTFDIAALTVDEVLDRCEAAELADLSFLKEAVEMNMALAKAGMEGSYGLSVGLAIRHMVEEGIVRDDLVSRVKIAVASACDFRMGGGNGAAMTLTGSGNQGIEAFLPVAVVAADQNAPEEKLLRALMISAALTVYIKSHIGRLSPICGAALSGAAASSAIVWLLGGTRRQMKGAIQDMLGTLSGMLCDGAKDGCALKLANCAGEAVMAAAFSLRQRVIQKTDGIVEEEVEDTIKNVSLLSRVGMSRMDMQIIEIMENKQAV